MAWYEVEPRRAMMCAGLAHMILGVLGPMFWGLSWIYLDVDTSASPLWGGLVFFIPTGVITLSAAIKERKDFAKIAALMAIPAFMTAIGVIVTTSLAISKDNQRPIYQGGDLTIDGFLLAIGCTELTASIISGTQSMLYVRQQGSSGPSLGGDLTNVEGGQ